MIYLKKTTDIQEIHIPRQTVLGSAYVETNRTYDDGYRDGMVRGEQIQKNKLTNITITQNGEYTREDGYRTVTVDVPTEGGDCSEAYDNGYADGYNQGQAECPEGGDLNIGTISTSLGVGKGREWTRAASDFGLDGISEITIDGSQYQEWTKAYTLLQAYQNTEETYITENGEYRANIGYDGYALKGYNVGWVIDVIPTIDTDVEIWVKPYDDAPNYWWQGFIGSQMNDDDNTTFQIRKTDCDNIFNFRFGEQIFQYGYENERWYRLRMNRNGVWVNGEQVCGWDVQAFEENSNPLMINGIYNLGFEGENYRMNHASYGYVYFHNTDSLLVPFQNELFIGNNNQTIERPAAEGATLQYEMEYYPKGYTKVTVDVPTEGGDCSESYDKGYEDGYNQGQAECPEGGSCNLEDKWVRPSMNDRDDNGLIVVEEDEEYDGLNRVIIDPTTIYNEGRADVGCNLEDKWVTPSMNDRGDGSSVIVVEESEGYDGLSRVVIDPYTIYNEGIEEGRNQGGEGDCVLEHLTVTDNGYYEPKAEEFNFLKVDENSAFDTGVKLVENTNIEIYFNTGDNWDNIPTLIGCEDGDWNNTTFAVRWHGDNLSIKIGSQQINIPMGAEDLYTKFHKLKFGKYEGVYLDDNFIEPFDNTEWTMSQNTIYIGAMHNTTDGDANGVWRPWNGYIGGVKIHGEKNGEVRDFTFTCGDFGRWGEYETEGDILPNIMGEGGATFLCCKQYGNVSYDGYSSVSVNIDVEPYKEEGRNEIKNKLQSIEITENGTYSINDVELINYIEFDGNSYFDTNIVPTEQTKIEVRFRCQGENWYEDMYILGCSQLSLHIGGTALNGKWAEAITGNIQYYENEWTTATFDRDNLCSNYECAGWNEGDKDSGWEDYNETIKIGKLGDEQLFKQQIAYVKIWVNKDDDSTMTLFKPKDMEQGAFGLVNSEGTEYNYIENLGEGTTTFMSEWGMKYGVGWREINVNVNMPSFSFVDIMYYTTTDNQPINDLSYINLFLDENEEEIPQVHIYMNGVGMLLLTKTPKKISILGVIMTVEWRNRLKTVVLPYGLIALETNLFGGCINLQSVVLQENILTVYGNVFGNNTQLTDLYINSPSAPSLSNYTWENMNTNVVVHHPSGVDYSSWDNLLTSLGWTTDNNVLNTKLY